MASPAVAPKPTLAPPHPPTSNGVSGSGPVFRQLELNGQVGFHSLPYQVQAKAEKCGFIFNLLCVGESGIGKTTLMQSLFNQDFNKLLPCSAELDTVELRSETLNFREQNVTASVTVVETAGFEHNRVKSTEDIVSYVEKQFNNYLSEELKKERRLYDYRDSRIHACLYFVSANSMSLGFTTAEINCLRALSSVVNVILIIAKADIISREDLTRFKKSIVERLAKEKIDLYRFPTDDVLVSEDNHQLNAALPFAVVGSNDFIEQDGKRIRARTFPWGKILIENEEHSDFVKLRKALLRVNIVHLHERTHEVLYENYRRRVLLERLGGQELSGIKMLQKLAGSMTNSQQLNVFKQEKMRQVTDYENEFIARKEKVLKERTSQEKQFDVMNDTFNNERNAFENEKRIFESAKASFLSKKAKK